jgi:hypothetical protein
MNKGLQDAIANLDESEMQELRKHIDGVMETRRSKPQMEDIKPGMSDADKQRAR